MRWATLRYWKQPPWFFSLPAWWGTGSGFTLRPSGQVFLKAGVLPRLEKQRERLVSQSLVLLQAACRGFLSRQMFRKLKVVLLCSGPWIQQGAWAASFGERTHRGWWLSADSPTERRETGGPSRGPFLLPSCLSLAYSTGRRLAGSQRSGCHRGGCLNPWPCGVSPPPPASDPEPGCPMHPEEPGCLPSREELAMVAADVWHPATPDHQPGRRPAPSQGGT